jgi:hypothetical protein
VWCAKRAAGYDHRYAADEIGCEAGSRSTWFSANRYSTATSCPSTKPVIYLLLRNSHAKD